MRTALVLPAFAALIAAACSEPISDSGLTDNALVPEAEEHYQNALAGRWGETAACDGLTWKFNDDSFATPGEVSCTIASLSQSEDGVIRIGGRDCVGEGAAQPDVVIDAWVDGDTVSVVGVDSAIDTPGWARCLQA